MNHTCKRLFCLLLSVLIFMSFSACSQEERTSTEVEKESVETQKTQGTSDNIEEVGALEDATALPENMLIATVPATLSQYGSYYTDNGSGWWFIGKYERNQINTITFLDTLANQPTEAWDVSAEQNGKVMAWVEQNENGNNLYIAGEGGVYAPVDASSTFRGFENVTEINFNSCFYTNYATNMFNFFKDCSRLTTINLSGFNTANVNTMGGMFSGCEKLQSLDLRSFDTSNTTFMAGMFYNCAALTEIELSSFNTGKVTDFRYMFQRCSSLTTMDLSGFDFTAAEYMNEMFDHTQSLMSIGCKITPPEGAKTDNMYYASGLPDA